MKTAHITLGATCTLVLTFMWAGCAPQTLAPRPYMAWISDPAHGLVQERTFNAVSMRLIYRPLTELALTEHGGNINKAQLADVLNSRAGSYYFTLRFKALHTGDVLDAGGSVPDDYYAKQYYFTSLVADDLSLVIGNDTLPCALAHFERTYGAVPFNDLVVSFIDDGADEDGEDLKLIYNDHAFGSGKVEFTIRREDLDRIPVLKLS